jgi:hypothetical protein
MGESAQLNFAPQIFGRSFADLGEFPKSKNFWLDIGRNSPQSKKIENYCVDVFHGKFVNYVLKNRQLATRLLMSASFCVVLSEKSSGL